MFRVKPSNFLRVLSDYAYFLTAGFDCHLVTLIESSTKRVNSIGKVQCQSVDLHHVVVALGARKIKAASVHGCRFCTALAFVKSRPNASSKDFETVRMTSLTAQRNFVLKCVLGRLGPES